MELTNTNYYTQISNKDLLYSTGNQIQYLLINCSEYKLKRITKSLCYIPETNTPFSINYIPVNSFQQNKAKSYVTSRSLCASFLFPQNKCVQVLGHIAFFFFFLQRGQILFLSGYNLFTVLSVQMNLLQLKYKVMKTPEAGEHVDKESLLFD